MADIALRLGVDTLIIDGAMGTMLQSMGVSTSMPLEFLNVSDEETVQEVHRLYRLAGADCATTNTFGATRTRLSRHGLADQVESINRAGVRLARSSGAPHVLADVGPCGLMLEPQGDATFDEVYDQYAEQIEALASEKPDAILIETMTDIADARTAYLAAREVCDLPVLVSCYFDETGHMPLSGTEPETAAIILTNLGVDAIGINCSENLAFSAELVRRLRAFTHLPILVQPSAGLPVTDSQGENVYPGNPEQFAHFAKEAYKAGASLIGSCCGSTPAFTSALAAEVATLPAPQVSEAELSGQTYVASPGAHIGMGEREPCRIIGGRINPAEDQDLAKELAQGNFALIKEYAQGQVEAGADMLSITVGNALKEVKRVLPQAVLSLSSATTAPLVINTTDFEALEAALRIYPGRALVNYKSNDPDSYMQLISLANKYGAAVIVQASDAEGIPDDAESRVKIVRSSIIFGQREGMRKQDFVADGLAYAASDEPEFQEQVVRTIALLKERDITTLLDVSNMSSDTISQNASSMTLLDAALEAGLDAVVVDSTAMQKAITLAKQKN